MQPIFGFFLYFVACLVVAVIANKRGRSGLLFFFLSVFMGLGLAMVIGAVAGGMAAGLGAFLIPVALLMVILSSKTAEALALEKGVFGDFRKCPFCAESIRKEASKCKHCGSAVEPIQSTAKAETEKPLVNGPKPMDPEDMACVSCQKNIPKTAFSCPFCGHRYKDA